MAARLQVGDLYRAGRLRVMDLLEGLEEGRWSTPVPACPGWDVHDVTAHLVGVAEDALDGRLGGPPDPEQTAQEVARHVDAEPSELLGRWAAIAPAFEEQVSAASVWPAFFDVLSHEHDLHGALGTEGDRNSAGVALAAKLLVRSADLGRPFQVDTGTSVLSSAVGAADAGVEGSDGPLELRCSAFDAFRLRLGRRSRSQVLGMDWSEDPGDSLDRLFVFGPAERDLVE